MEAIRNLVQVLVAVIVLAVFLDMLLPRGDLKGYVRMVMGLFVMVALLQTAGELFHLKMDYLLEPLGSARTGFDQEFTTKQIFKKGEEISAIQRQKAADHYRRGIEGQVLALARLHSGQKVTAVEVKIKEGEGADFGRLEEIVLHVSSDTGPDNGKEGCAVQAVSKGVINGDVKTVIPNCSPDIADLAGVLAGFYNLEPRQVKIAKE